MNLRDFSTAAIDELDAVVQASYVSSGVVLDSLRLLIYVCSSSRPASGLDCVLESVPLGIFMSAVLIDCHSYVPMPRSEASRLVLSWNLAALTPRLFDVELV